MAICHGENGPKEFRRVFRARTHDRNRGQEALQSISSPQARGTWSFQSQIDRDTTLIPSDHPSQGAIQRVLGRSQVVQPSPQSVPEPSVTVFSHCLSPAQPPRPHGRVPSPGSRPAWTFTEAGLVVRGLGARLPPNPESSAFAAPTLPPASGLPSVVGNSVPWLG